MKSDFFDLKTLREDYDTEFKSAEGSIRLIKIKVSQESRKEKPVFINRNHCLKGEHPIQGDIVQRVVREANSEHLAGNSEHLSDLQRIADQVKEVKKSPKDLVRRVVLEMCLICPLSISEMSWLLNRREDSLRNHYVNPLCDERFLTRLYPNILNHPQQKYCTIKRS